MTERIQSQFVYIDESGHTGDLLKSGGGFEFNGQPHFVLAAVGPMQAELAEALLSEVAERHKLRAKEVKSKGLSTRPGVARDLAIALGEHSVPIFVEAVDKVFYLITCIINYHILPPSAGTPLDEGDRYVRNHLADYLYRRRPDAVLNAFIDACRQDTPEAVRASLESVKTWARTTHGLAEERMLLQFIQASIDESIDDFQTALSRDIRGHRHFLPLPDAGKRNATYWVLPNYSSLTNLYARINRYRRGRLRGLSLVHDDQSQYDDVLRAAKSAVESFVDTSSHAVKGADYAFEENAELSFAVSSETPGLMIADVVAGHVRRTLMEHTAQTPIHDLALDAFLAIWDVDDPERGNGINLVLPTDSVQRLQLLALYRRQMLNRGHE